MKWMGREKVIKGLEICSDCGFCELIKKYDVRCPYRNYDGKGCDRSQLLTDALALLKEQEAVEPFHKCVGKEYTLIEDSHFDYCPYCGKPITWEGR